MQKKVWMTILAAVAIVAVVVTIVVLVITLGGSSTYDKCNQFNAPSGLLVIRNSNGISISWFSPWPNDECGIFYVLQYDIDDGKEEEVYIHGTSHSLPHPMVCSFLNLRLWAVNEAGNRSNNSATQTYLEMPENGAVTNIEFLPTAAGLEVTWTRPTTLENCTILYEIKYNPYITGLGTQQVETSKEFFVIPDDKYCFAVLVTIFTYIFDRNVPDSVSSEIFIDSSVPTDLVVTQSLESFNEMIVRWSKHSRHDVCSLTYEVQFSLDGLTNEDTILTQDLEATFPAHFCSSFLFVMRVHSAITSSTSSWTTVERTLDPTELGPVQDPSVIVEENLATISWYPPESANDCIDLEYEVSAINEETQEEASCTGPITCSTEVTEEKASCIAPITCSLSLNSFCSRTTFTIGTISGITQDKSISHECGTH